MRKPKNKKSNKAAIVFVLSLIILFSSLNGTLAYWYLRAEFMQQDTEAYKSTVSAVTKKINVQSDSEFLPNEAKLIGESIFAEKKARILSIYNMDKQVLWTSLEPDNFALTEFIDSSSLVIDEFYNFKHKINVNDFMDLFNTSYKEYQVFSPILNVQGEKVGSIKAIRDYNQAIRSAISVSVYLFCCLLLSLLIVFVLSYRFFRCEPDVRSIANSGDDDLNEKVIKLSKIINKNKQLQRNMKSASGRAVELNERFLRKVGADLHDGPAQSIGYALLKLNQIKGKPIAKELGHEFPGIIASLDDSLNEIRGISSGLVLPELEQMTLEEAIHKVIDRHIDNTETEVSEIYTNLPDKVALPIKICAYRLVQEGLNNAYKHGKANKCRFLAQVSGSTLTLTLKDNGSGFRKSTLNTDGGHLGLAGLQDRIESLGGTISIKSELGTGTAIKVTIELPDEIEVGHGHSVSSIIH